MNLPYLQAEGLHSNAPVLQDLDSSFFQYLLTSSFLPGLRDSANTGEKNGISLLAYKQLFYEIQWIFVEVQFCCRCFTPKYLKDVSLWLWTDIHTMKQEGEEGRWRTEEGRTKRERTSVGLPGEHTGGTKWRPEVVYCSICPNLWTLWLHRRWDSFLSGMNCTLQYSGRVTSI